MPNSPPYFPLRRSYGGSFDGKAVGWESTVEEYLDHLVTIYHEAKRVLTRRGSLIVVMKDSYSTTPGARYRAHSYKRRRPGPQKEWVPDGTPIQGGDRPLGNLLVIPERFALKMQDDGWIFRNKLIVKINSLPDTALDRTALDYEVVMVFTKQLRYYWNQDAIREPREESAQPYVRGNLDEEALKSDAQRDLRVIPNPMGRIASSIREFNASGYTGMHPATIAEDFAEWILSAACDDNAHVCDIFGGAGTFALAALRLGHRATSIDIFGEYTEEARKRLSTAAASPATQNS
jgi:DNA modification methylase